ncbi:MAG TPA: chemotaxis protein CheW [Methylomirabilota bacterium]|jgi:purine-binding chemotaxis protein CheW
MPLERAAIVSARRSTPRARVDRLVVFTLAGVHYGLDAQVVRHSLPAADAQGGVVRFVGAEYPLIDLRHLFALHAGTGDARLLLVGDPAGRRGALVVDGLADLAAVEETAIVPLPAVFRGRERRWFRGVTRIDGKIVVVVNLDGLLTG